MPISLPGFFLLLPAPSLELAPPTYPRSSAHAADVLPRYRPLPTIHPSPKTPSTAKRTKADRVERNYNEP
jgi:hypothetical protein